MHNLNLKFYYRTVRYRTPACQIFIQTKKNRTLYLRTYYRTNDSHTVYLSKERQAVQVRYLLLVFFIKIVSCMLCLQKKTQSAARNDSLNN